MSNTESGGIGSALVKPEKGFRAMSGILSGLFLFVIAWSLFFGPATGHAYADLMNSMFGAGPAIFAGLGLLVMILLPGNLSFRNAGIAIALSATLTGIVWLLL